MPDRDKRKTTKKEKTNQYINETELKSLMIRINNKTFLDFLSNSFSRLDKYLTKYQLELSINNRPEYISVLEDYILRTSASILKNKKHQLMLLSDVVVKEYRKIIETKRIKDIISIMLPLSIKMRNKNILLKNIKRADKARMTKYLEKHKKSKSQKFKRALKNRIVQISERNYIDKQSYERFGEMVLLIIKNILKKPKFSGYTYRDEFYSDSTDKILRYLKNYNHNLISKINGQEVNAFSYLSQYVHNSILFIIKSKNEEKTDIETYVNTYNENIRLLYNESEVVINDKILELDLPSIKKSIYDDILNESKDFSGFDIIKIQYPEDYKISLSEYNKLKSLNSLLNKTIQITRKRG